MQSSVAFHNTLEALVTESDTIFGQGTILKPTPFHIGREVALDAQAAALVYIYARISQIAEIHTSFYVTALLAHGTGWKSAKARLGRRGVCLIDFLLGPRGRFIYFHRLGT